MIVDRVKINNVPGDSGLSHIAVQWGTGQAASREAHGSTTTYNGPVVISHGAKTQIAFNNHDVSFSGDQTVAPGFEALASSVAEVLQLLATTDFRDDDDRLIAEEAGQDLLAELVRDDPDRSLLKRGLASLRGVVATLTTAAAKASGTQLGTDAVERLHELLPQLQL